MKTIKNSKLKTQNNYDLAIIGGGIMGLMTAYFASEYTDKIVILEKSTVGNKQAASFSYTRSMRTDYLDPFYSLLANESRELWLGLQKQTDTQLLVSCGCLNLVKKTVTPKVSETYGSKSYQIINKLGYQPIRFTKEVLKNRYKKFDADEGYLDTKGGYFDLKAVTNALLAILQKRGVNIKENTQINSISETENSAIVNTATEKLTSKKLVVTTGAWTNDILSLVESNDLVLPLSFDRPKECKYVYPPSNEVEDYLPGNFPVFAYLDVGIYGHPVYDRKKGALKISYYNPPDLKTQKNSKINSVSDFINECIPDLKEARLENVKDADQCVYDLVADDNFILGKLPKFKNIVIGCGWRGTGYKFAPLIGKVLSQLTLFPKTDYDISRFNPERFA